MPRVTKQSISYAIGLLVRRQMRVSTRQVTALIGGSRRDITRLMRELRAEKGRRTWAQWVADNGPQGATVAPPMTMTRKKWTRIIEGRESAATVRQKLQRQATSAPPAPVVETPTQSPARPLQQRPSAPPLPTCSICDVRYRPAYPEQPPCCLDPGCGREYHRRRQEGLL